MNSNLNKIAYLIGNNEYEKFSKLSACVNDTILLSEKLKQCGFDIQLFHNLNYGTMKNTIEEFKYSSMDKDVALFYYAGHGFELRGMNYLSPIDGNNDDLEAININITDMVNKISKSRDFVCIVILDCCRNILTSNSRGISKTGAIGCNFKNPVGTFIAFSTSSGEKSIEKNGNGIFTKCLANHLLDVNKTIEQVFKETRKDIILNFNSDEQNTSPQISWEYSSLVNDFYFNQNMIYNNLNELVESIVTNKYTYKQIISEIIKYCKNNNFPNEQYFKIKFEILNEIDKYIKE